MKMQLPYRHTQIGWVILAGLLLPLGVLVPVVLMSGSSVPTLVAGAIVPIIAVLFGTLTVRVDEHEIRIRFGPGLVQRRFALSTVRGFAQVESPLIYGWGIRWYPGGVLYNVSGFSAIELALSDGRRVRIGTDEPDKLFLVLESILGASAPLSDFPVNQDTRSRNRLLVLVLSLVGVVLVALPFLLHAQAKPPVVTLTPDSLRIDNLFYGQDYALSEISRVELLDSLPRIRARTNGYAANGTLRGWFLLDRLGSGKLFVELSHPPYVGIFLSKGFVILNYENQRDTRQLFEALSLKVPAVP